MRRKRLMILKVKTDNVKRARKFKCVSSSNYRRKCYNILSLLFDALQLQNFWHVMISSVNND